MSYIVGPCACKCKGQKDSQFTFLILLIIQSTFNYITLLYTLRTFYLPHIPDQFRITRYHNIHEFGLSEYLKNKPHSTYCEVDLMSVPRHHLLRHPLTSVWPMFCMCTIYDHSYAFLLLQSPEILPWPFRDQGCLSLQEPEAVLMTVSMPSLNSVATVAWKIHTDTTWHVRFHSFKIP